MKKLYVLTRRDLSAPQRLVQSCHAVAELLKGGPVDAEWNDTIVVLGVNGEDDLCWWGRKLEEAKHRWAEFKESYFNDQRTALAFVGTPPGLEGDLSQLRLL